MKLRNWNELQREIAFLKSLYPAPRGTKGNRHPARVPVDFPDYTTGQRQDTPTCTALMGTPTACRKKDRLASKWQRLAEHP